MKLTNILLVVVILLQISSLFIQTKPTNLPDIKALENKIDSLNKKEGALLKQRDTLVNQVTNIHNETNKVLEKIIITPDSMQFLITDELIKEHRRLDSL